MILSFRKLSNWITIASLKILCQKPVIEEVTLVKKNQTKVIIGAEINKLQSCENLIASAFAILLPAL